MGALQKEQDSREGRVCVGRQAVLDAQSRVVGYELLYRASETATEAVVIDDTAATATVVVNAVAEMGLSAVVGERDMFLNCSREVLLLELETLLPTRQVVLEVLESVDVDEAMSARLTELRQAGFRVALDDYVLGDPRRELMHDVDIIKIDLLAMNADELREVVQDELSAFNGPLLAEKVEDEATFQRCKELGFQLFQGYFFCKPNVMTQKASPEDRTNVVRILSEIQRHDITVDEAVDLIRQDVTVSYRLLNCLNSVVFGMRHPVESLRQALVLLGMPRVRAWVSLMGMSTVKGKSTEIVRIALVRGSMAQELSRLCKVGDPDTMFTVGLLSVLDAVLDMEMAEVMRQLPLSDAIKQALMGERCREGDVLQAVLAYERGHFAGAISSSHGINLDALGAAWLTAVSWADRTTSALLGH